MTNAFAVLVLTVLSAIFGFNYRRAGGPGWAFFLPLAMVAMVGIQITLGFAGIRGFHVFWGVLYLCMATAFCSYTWRHRPAETAQPAAKASSDPVSRAPASEIRAWPGTHGICFLFN